MNDKFTNQPRPGPEELLAGEQALLSLDAGSLPPAPNRHAMLSAVYAAGESNQKETTMIPNPIARLFAGKHPALRLALGGALLLAVLGLSMVFPRPAPPAWAAAEGYMLAFDFGEGSTQEAVQPILDQLHAKVLAFKQAHNIPWEKPHKFGTHAEKRVIKRVERHGDGPSNETIEEKSRVIAMVALPDASLLEELQAELATIPGLPAPAQTNATWFAANGLPDPDKPGINLALDLAHGDDGATAPHMFFFPEDATEEQIETEISAWLAQNKPEFKGTVDVTLKRDGERLELSVKIEGKPSELTVDVKGPEAETS